MFHVQNAINENVLVKNGANIAAVAFAFTAIRNNDLA